MEWSAPQYLKFADERTRAVRDLLAAVPTAAAARVIDLGCGPGNSTEVLAARFPDAAVEGLDRSADMLQAARRRLPAVTFRSGDIATWQSDIRYDVILSNAALHWVADHATLLPRLVAMLAPGGSLAIQMPDNLAEPSHVLMRQPRWAPLLAGVAAQRAPLGDAAFYYRVFTGCGARADIWRATYYHVLDGTAAVVEWFKGSGLLPFLDAVPAEERAEYLASYQAAVTSAYPAQPDGRVLLPFPRLFMVATR